MEKLLDAKVLAQVDEIFKGLIHPVRLIFFGISEDCEYCPQIEQLLTEVAGRSSLISLEVHDFKSDSRLAATYRIEKAPGFILAGEEGGKAVDYGIRFYGIPSGHEFTTLINDILFVSQRDSGLSDATKAYLAGLKKPLHLEVFVTPTCPYCPRAVVLAHQLAFESALVTADMVEAVEFPELSARYGVSGVPQTTMNYGAASVVGLHPETELLDEIRRVLEKEG